jgi:hypothetical protein
MSTFLNSLKIIDECAVCQEDVRFWRHRWYHVSPTGQGLELHGEDGHKAFGANDTEEGVTFWREKYKGRKKLFEFLDMTPGEFRRFQEANPKIAEGVEK